MQEIYFMEEKRLLRHLKKIFLTCIIRSCIIVGKILEFKKKYDNKKRGGSKTLPPQEMLCRLPISLAQLKAGNNSQDIKNEIRQVLYFLYRFKKISKTIYNDFTNCI